MERAAVDRKARAASLQDELNATVRRLSTNIREAAALRPAIQDYAAASSFVMSGTVTSAIAKGSQRLPTMTDAPFCIDRSAGFR